MAGQLDTSTASVNSALQRARKAIGSAAPTQQAVLRDLGDATVEDDAARAYVPGGLDVLTLHAGRVAEVVAFLSADFTRFGLPARIRP